jgi:aspartate/methionine/tyrosine aminotransferase
LTKLYLGPGWRLGWLIVYGSEEKKKVYNRYLQKIFNITLMPNTIMQATLPDILNNIDNESHLQNCLSLMKANK